MTPQFQTHHHDPASGSWGDCNRAAYATILDLPVEQVPHWADQGREPDTAAVYRARWLADRGLADVTLALQTDPAGLLRAMGHFNPGLYWIMGCCSGRGVPHSVVCLGDTVVHDPATTAINPLGYQPALDGNTWANWMVPIHHTDTRIGGFRHEERFRGDRRVEGRPG